MANLKVTLVRLCKLPVKDANGNETEQWGRYKVPIGKNGKVRPNFVLVKVGAKSYVQLEAPEGRYQIRVYDGRKTVYTNTDNDPQEALKATILERLRRKLEKEAEGTPLTIEQDTNPRVHLRTKGKEFVARQIKRRKFRAAVTAEQAITEFLAVTKKTYADELTEDVILDWYNKLQDEVQENEDRTVYNKHVSVFGMLRWAGVDTKPLAPNGPPTFSERAVVIYNGEELRKLFAVCNPYQRLVFLLLLKTGLRMGEAMKLRWPEIDFVTRLIHVASVSRLKKRVKDLNERLVPCPLEVIELLKLLRERRPNSKYVLGTKNDTPNKKMREMLKGLARKAQLNCRDCDGCLGKAEECSMWNIKKFRATYITMLLRDGYDVRTVMDYSGHEDMETMMKYLAVAQKLRGRIDTVNFLEETY